MIINDNQVAAYAATLHQAGGSMGTVLVLPGLVFVILLRTQTPISLVQPSQNKGSQVFMRGNGDLRVKIRISASGIRVLRGERQIARGDFLDMRLG